MVMTISTIHYWHPAASSLPQFSQSEGFNQIINRSSKKLSLDGLFFSLRWRILVMQFREETKRHQKICDIVSNKMVVYPLYKNLGLHTSHTQLHPVLSSNFFSSSLQPLESTQRSSPKQNNQKHHNYHRWYNTDDQHLQKSSQPAV